MTHWKPLCAVSLALGLWLWLANDGRLHWDEPGYLYAAAYLDVGEIVAAEFQPSGVAWHSTNRILHILFCHALYSVFGVKPIVIDLITGIYLALILGAVYIGFLVVRALVAIDAWSPAAILLVMFSPICLWLSFKTMPEAPAFFFASTSVLALLKSLDGRPVPWIVVGAPSLTIVALFKATLALSFLSFGLTLLLFNGFGFPRRRIVINSLLIGVGSLALFAVSLNLFGISLDRYLSTWSVVQNVGDPVISRLAFTAIEAGLLYAALPLSLLAPATTPDVVHAGVVPAVDTPISTPADACRGPIPARQSDSVDGAHRCESKRFESPHLLVAKSTGPRHRRNGDSRDRASAAR